MALPGQSRAPDPRTQGPKDRQGPWRPTAGTPQGKDRLRRVWASQCTTHPAHQGLHPRNLTPTTQDLAAAFPSAHTIMDCFRTSAPLPTRPPSFTGGLPILSGPLFPCDPSCVHHSTDHTVQWSCNLNTLPPPRPGVPQSQGLVLTHLCVPKAWPKCSRVRTSWNS